MDKNIKTELEAATFRRIVEHFRSHTEVQNIEMMNLANFCRNCISKWYLAAAEQNDVAMDYDKAREIIYGMPYPKWKKKYQKEATVEQKKKYDEVVRQRLNQEAK